LFYYYFYRLKYTEAEDQLKKYIDSKLPESDVADQHLYAQLCWAQKNWDCAIQKDESVINSVGDNTKPKIYRLLADAYYQKGDYTNARKYSDLFFAKKNPADVILPDFETRALILGKLGASPDDVYNTYISGVAIDTTVDAKIGYLKKGATYFKDAKNFDKQALVLQKILEIKPNPIINDYFDPTLALYFDSAYGKSYAMAMQMRDKFPDQVYGYDWVFINAVLIDTVKQDSIAVPAATGLYDFTLRDSSKYKAQYIKSTRYLAAYYINKAKDKDKSVEYFRKWQAMDTANAQMIQGYIDQIEKMNKPKTGATTNSKGTSKAKTPAPSPMTKNKKIPAAVPKTGTVR